MYIGNWKLALHMECDGHGSSDNSSSTPLHYCLECKWYEWDSEAGVVYISWDWICGGFKTCYTFWFFYASRYKSWGRRLQSMSHMQHAGQYNIINWPISQYLSTFNITITNINTGYNHVYLIAPHI